MNSQPDEELKKQFNVLKEEYIKLLNDKDVLLNWGKPQLEALYVSRIGRLQLERLQLQLHIKALKRKIQLLQSAINRNVPADTDAIELQVASELAEAEHHIMQQANKIATSEAMLSNLASPERSAELRKIYKQFAKQLHPDVNQNLTNEQKDLWHIVKEAYEIGDLEKLKAFEVVYEKELKAAEKQMQELTPEELQLRVEVLKEGIKVLHEQVKNIKGEFPFTLEQQIKDEEWVTTENAKVQEEIKALKLYEEELTLQYRQMIAAI
ncbi:MAG TPA: hypothetical protein VF622_16145 [Segetibacter sp.]|jgi:hypothetical protein